MVFLFSNTLFYYTPQFMNTAGSFIIVNFFCPFGYIWQALVTDDTEISVSTVLSRIFVIQGVLLRKSHFIILFMCLYFYLCVFDACSLELPSAHSFTSLSLLCFSTLYTLFIPSHPLQMTTPSQDAPLDHSESFHLHLTCQNLHTPFGFSQHPFCSQNMQCMVLSF